MQVLTAPASLGHSDCERIVDAALVQPVLAVTSMAYVGAGVAVVTWAVRARDPLAGAAGVALSAVGARSFAYHGPQPSWLELAHDWPVVAVGAVVGLGRTGRSGERQSARLFPETVIDRAESGHGWSSAAWSSVNTIGRRRIAVGGSGARCHGSDSCMSVVVSHSSDR
jgi:hypothetical protein